MMPPDANRYMANGDATDPCAEAAKFGTPLLVVQGGSDTSVPVGHAHKLVAARGARGTTLLVIPELSHRFKVVPAGTSQMEAFGLPGPCDPRVADGVTSWIMSLETRYSVPRIPHFAPLAQCLL